MTLGGRDASEGLARLTPARRAPERKVQKAEAGATRPESLPISLPAAAASRASPGVLPGVGDGVGGGGRRACGAGAPGEGAASFAPAHSHSSLIVTHALFSSPGALGG